MALIPDSKVSDQATKFIKYITGPDGQKVYTKETTHLPTLNALLADPSLYDPAHAQFLAPAADRQEPAAARGGCRLLGCPHDRHGFGRAQLEDRRWMPSRRSKPRSQPQLDAVGC